MNYFHRHNPISIVSVITGNKITSKITFRVSPLSFRARTTEKLCNHIIINHLSFSINVYTTVGTNRFECCWTFQAIKIYWLKQLFWRVRWSSLENHQINTSWTWHQVWQRKGIWFLQNSSSYRTVPTSRLPPDKTILSVSGKLIETSRSLRSSTMPGDITYLDRTNMVINWLEASESFLLLATNLGSITSLNLKFPYVLNSSENCE